MAARLNLGVISCSSSKSFPPISPPMFVSPVIFPPGRARLATSPVPTGFRATRHHDRNGAGGFLEGKGRARNICHNDVHFQADKLGYEIRVPLTSTLRRPIDKSDVLT